MSPAANTLLALILVALGFIGIILSFQVPDKKKSTISLALAGVIVVLGLYQWGSQSFVRYRMNQRMQELQKDRQVDLDALRERLKNQASGTNPGTAPKKP